MIKAVKIKETFEDFLEEHPELRVEKDSEGNIEHIIFPPEAEKTSYTILYGNISIYYIYQGETIRFPVV